jgi:hypothetical protein
VKVGDKLYCKKTINHHDTKLAFRRYDIIYDYPDYDFVECNYYEIIDIRKFHDELGYEFKSLYFSSGGILKDIHVVDYLCDEKELRKMKLNKLNANE